MKKWLVAFALIALPLRTLAQSPDFTDQGDEAAADELRLEAPPPTRPDESAPTQAGAPTVEASEDAPTQNASEDVPTQPALTPPAPHEATFDLDLGAQLFGEYQFDHFGGDADPSSFHRFELPRVWLWLGASYRGARARVLLEGTRTGDEAALFGVDGDSLVVRFREAWAGYRAFDALELRAGMVPTLIAPQMTALWGLRVISQSAGRRFELLEPADLGATLSYDLPMDIGRASVGFFNGEGYRFRERNRGKSSEFALTLHPLFFAEKLRPLTVFAAYQLGSRGVGALRSDRLATSLAWSAERFSVGLGYTWLRGIEERADLRGHLVEAWAQANPWRGLVLSARFQHFVRGQSGDTLSEWIVSAGYRVDELVGIHLAAEQWIAGDQAAGTVPGYERFRVRVVVEGQFDRMLRVAGDEAGNE